jgi:zinc/manganese transport system substrate-binding protein
MLPLVTRLAVALVTLGLVVPLTVPRLEGASKLRVVTTTTDLKALTEAVGGGLLEVDSLVRGNQNAHDFEVRPSQMVKLRRADLVILNGLDLDGWAEVSIQGANNPRLVPSGLGRVDASAGIQVLEVPTGRIDRSMGDVHPFGNPHYTLDPGMAGRITANIVEGVARVVPEHRTALEQRRQDFLGRLEAAQVRWLQAMAPFKGARVVVNHNQWIYFLTRFGLVQAGTVEERPGIPATPPHLARLIAQMKADQVKAIILEAWGDRTLAERLAADTSARVVPLANAVGARKGTDSYLDWVDYNVTTLAQALR